jgi:tetratricopeptide (TPR) repeat protein
MLSIISFSQLRLSIVFITMFFQRFPAADSRDEASGSDSNPNAESQNTDIALQFLLQGNSLSAQGRHIEAIWMWKNASLLRPDSNVPWNNIANAYMALGQQEDALLAANTAFGLKVDYMSGTTLSNVLKAKKQYREAEETLLSAIEQASKTNERYEHPFWALASLYFEQGDFLEFVKYASLGFEQRPGVCSSGGPNAEACTHGFEDAIKRKLYNACMHDGLFDLTRNLS